IQGAESPRCVRSSLSCRAGSAVALTAAASVRRGHTTRTCCRASIRYARAEEAEAARELAQRLGLDCAPAPLQAFAGQRGASSGPYLLRSGGRWSL
ncbi:unnamed protein product, partial [Polarella glacialis]